LKFVIEAVSKEFNFFNLGNHPEGDWQDFLMSDINLLIRIIPKFDLRYFIKEFDDLKK